MNLNTLARVTAHHQTSLREGLKIVRRVIASNPHPDGFTRGELFKLLAKEPPPADFKPLELSSHPPSYVRSGGKKAPPVVLPPRAPRPNHPIKSMTFLKRTVLPILEGNKELKKVRTTRVLSNPAQATPRAGGKKKNKPQASHATAATAAPVTVWVWRPVDKSKLPRPPAPEPPRKIFGVEVGVGADWSHLSKRRRRARVGKVRRDVSAMKVARLVRAQKAREAMGRVRAAAQRGAVVQPVEGVFSRGQVTKGMRRQILKEGNPTAKESSPVVMVSQVAP